MRARCCVLQCRNLRSQESPLALTIHPKPRHVHWKEPHPNAPVGWSPSGTEGKGVQTLFGSIRLLQGSPFRQGSSHAWHDCVSTVVTQPAAPHWHVYSPQPDGKTGGPTPLGLGSSRRMGMQIFRGSALALHGSPFSHGLRHSAM